MMHHRKLTKNVHLISPLQFGKGLVCVDVNPRGVAIVTPTDWDFTIITCRYVGKLR